MGDLNMHLPRRRERLLQILNLPALNRTINKFSTFIYIGSSNNYTQLKMTLYNLDVNVITTFHVILIA